MKESYIKCKSIGLSCGMDKFTIDIENTSLKERSENENILFVSQKLDDHHWYSLCSGYNEKVSDFQIISLKDIENNLYISSIS